MKGKISDKLEKVLDDPGARAQLRELLTRGNGGTVTVNGKVYTVKSNVRRKTRQN